MLSYPHVNYNVKECMENRSELLQMKDVLIWLHEKAEAAQIKTLQKIHHSTIRAMVTRGEFPKPIVLSPKKIYWNTKDLLEWWKQKVG